MATSFIKFSDKGYWMADDFVSLLARYLIETYKKMSVKKHWQGKMKDNLILIALGAGSGNKNLFLEEYLDSKNKIDDYISWVEHTKNYLLLKGEFILKEELNSFDYVEDFVFWKEDLKTKILISLYDEVINIIRGTGGGETHSKSVLPYNKVD